MSNSLSELRTSSTCAREVLVLQAAASSLLVTSNNVLDVSALEIGALYIEQTKFDLPRILQQLTSSMQFAAAQKVLFISS